MKEVTTTTEGVEYGLKRRRGDDGGAIREKSDDAQLVYHCMLSTGAGDDCGEVAWKLEQCVPRLSTKYDEIEGSR